MHALPRHPDLLGPGQAAVQPDLGVDQLPVDRGTESVADKPVPQVAGDDRAWPARQRLVGERQPAVGERGQQRGRGRLLEPDPGGVEVRGVTQRVGERL
jgi:hypothetical protein